MRNVTCPPQSTNVRYLDSNSSHIIWICFVIDAASAKRNIGAAKNSQAKVKRDATYDDFPDQSEIEAYQNGPFNYNDWSELYAFYGMPEISNEKRFLGKLLICCLPYSAH